MGCISICVVLDLNQAYLRHVDVVRSMVNKSDRWPFIPKQCG